MTASNQDTTGTRMEPAPQSVTGPRINKGLVIVNTGTGKGKTTAAMGVMLRGLGPGHEGHHAPVHQAHHGQLR